MAHSHLFAQLFHGHLRRQNSQHAMLRMKPLSYINEVESAVTHSSVLGLPCLESVAPSCSVQNQLIVRQSQLLEPAWDRARGRAGHSSQLSRNQAPRLIFLMPRLYRFVDYP